MLLESMLLHFVVGMIVKAKAEQNKSVATVQTVDVSYRLKDSSHSKILIHDKGHITNIW